MGIPFFLFIWMFQHDSLDTCCFECLICMCFIFLYLHNWACFTWKCTQEIRSLLLSLLITDGSWFCIPFTASLNQKWGLQLPAGPKVRNSKLVLAFPNPSPSFTLLGVSFLCDILDTCQAFLRLNLTSLLCCATRFNAPVQGPLESRSFCQNCRSYPSSFWWNEDINPVAISCLELHTSCLKQLKAATTQNQTQSYNMIAQKVWKNIRI